MPSISFSDTLMPFSEVFVSSSALLLNPLRVVVLPIKLTMTSCVNNGLPRQFCVIYAHRRCSILFHVLVPGGKWHTVTFSPASFANCWSSRFHNLVRLPWLPPPSAMMSNASALGYTTRPMWYHHRLILATAN